MIPVGTLCIIVGEVYPYGRIGRYGTVVGGLQDRACLSGIFPLYLVKIPGLVWDGEELWHVRPEHLHPLYPPPVPTIAKRDRELTV